MFLVQRRQCAICIYRPDNPLDLPRLEAEIADPHQAGFFVSYRVCHHAPPDSGVCCAGFWRAYQDDFTLVQLAQRLGCVRFVAVDVL